jgi:hypothetical protein
MKQKYTHKTYGVAQFYIPEGMYSIEELELLLVDIKAAKEQTEKSLGRVLKPLKERNNG